MQVPPTGRDAIAGDLPIENINFTPYGAPTSPIDQLVTHGYMVSKSFPEVWGASVAQQ